MKPPYSDRTHQAVLHLLQQGLAPSWRRVREITGSGSSTDLVREIKSVLAELAQRATAGDYPKEVQDAFWGLWTSAKAVASNELIALQEEAASKVLEAHASASAAKDAAEESQQKLDQAQKDIISLRAQLDEHKARETTQSQQIMDANDRLDAAATREAALGAQVAALNQKLLDQQQMAEAKLQDQIAERNAALADLAVESQQVIKRLETEVKAERERADRESARIMRAWDNERADLKKQLKEMSQDAKAVSSEILAGKERYLKAEAEHRVLQETCKHHEQRIEQLQLAVLTGEERIALLQEQMMELTRRIPQAEPKPGAGGSQEG